MAMISAYERIDPLNRFKTLGPPPYAEGFFLSLTTPLECGNR